jgi:hypothetical protein
VTDELEHDERDPWARRPDEHARAYDGFRTFRDLGTTRTIPPAAELAGVREDTARKWSARYDWHERATAWDDEVHRIEDRERLEAIRTMHQNHRRAGRAAMLKALQALDHLQPQNIPAGAAARLLDLGSRLERQTLTVSVEDLQGLADDEEVAEDPFERIARELAT